MNGDKCTVVAPVNIAVIKYWGKKNEELILPYNDSISVTLDTSIMCAKTTVCIRSDFKEDLFWLNGKKEKYNDRLQNCLKKIKELALQEKSVDESCLSWGVHVCSENNFPTAAGLASSAAGYASFVSALAKVYKLKSDISAIARLGSGSACRSVYGGFVRWHSGTDPLGTDCRASQIAPSTHWPEMRALILIVGDAKKKMSSTMGMKITAETSDLFQYRVKHCVPKRAEDMTAAILKKDFNSFAEITMKDSNQFHAVCLDSYPPFTYMTEVSHKIVELVHSYNDACGETKVAYTYDAGPNACLYLLEPEVPKMISLIKYIFPSTKLFVRDDLVMVNCSYITGLESTEDDVPFEILSKLSVTPQKKDLIKYVIYTKIGEGPTEVFGPHLLNENGEPIDAVV